MTPPAKDKSPQSQGGFRIVFFYALFGASWIFFSDSLIELLLDDKHLIARVSMYKGWLFIAITSLLLAVLIRRRVRALEESLQALSVAEAKLSNTIELAVDGIFFGDRDGTLIGANSRACGLTGYSRDELQGKRMENIFSDAEMERAPLRYDLIDQGLTVTTERQLIRTDGTMVTVEMRTKRMPDGTYQSFMRDISDRRQIEQSLAESEARFRDLAEMLPQPIFETDITGRFTYVNRRAFEMFGYQPDDLAQGVTINQTLVPAERERAAAKIQQLFSDPDSYDPGGEYTCQRKDGTVFEAFINSSPILRNGAPVGLRGVIVDISERKRAEELLRVSEEQVHQLNESLEKMVAERTEELQLALRQMESFSYSISHDLRAPLRAIDGFIQMLQEDCGEVLSSQARRLMARISHNARHMGELIDDLLLFSRLGRQPLNRQSLYPDKLVMAVLEDFTAEIEQRGIDIVIAQLPICQADPQLLRQVFANLIGNALKFTLKTTAPRIEIGTRMENGTPVFFVRDNGAGFDMTYADKLFGVFQRLHAQEEFEGTGVGLAIVQSIIQRHGGKIWAEGAVGQGATFSFTL